nr:hypothetical protein Itr_chr12CG32010 [Ipomoea trifida]GMD61823.1 hypothetical protein Iba_chr12aCG24360 [Ipomoea batatas]GMD67373.1 hypothetical protein Iba_chr12cCG23950 [Ipomoea batatas]
MKTIYNFNEHLLQAIPYKERQRIQS